MIAVNELGQQKCHSRGLLRDLTILMAPFAPHVAEELWQQLGGQGSVCDAAWPTWNAAYLAEDEMQLTVSFNGKARYQKLFPVDASKELIEQSVLDDERSLKYLEGKSIVKVIIVPRKIINIVIK